MNEVCVYDSTLDRFTFMQLSKAVNIYMELMDGYPVAERDNARAEFINNLFGGVEIFAQPYSFTLLKK